MASIDMKKTFVIDCFPESALKYLKTHTIVAIDVIRATTTVTTAVGLGRKVYLARTTDDAFILASRLSSPLLVGEVGGNVPYGFDITNSPAIIAERTDFERPMVFISSSGTRLILNADSGDPVYVACLRNVTAVAEELNRACKRIAIIGAGTRGQFRREDQICCAMLASKLADMGFESENDRSLNVIERWRGVDIGTIAHGRSARYLKDSGQEADLYFVLEHLDDLDVVPVAAGGEVKRL